MAVIKKFGDEHSNLLDQYERLTFEARLNQAILGRSLSESCTMRSQAQLAGSAPPPYLVTHQPRKGRPGSTIHKIMKKLLRPILERKGRGKKEVLELKNPMSWKALSKSMRV